MRTYESIEDILTEKIYSGTVASIEEFLGYTLDLCEVCDEETLKEKIHTKLDCMDEDDLIRCEIKYLS